MAARIQPCRDRNSIDLFGFVIHFDEKLQLEEIFGAGGNFIDFLPVKKKGENGEIFFMRNADGESNFTVCCVEKKVAIYCSEYRSWAFVWDDCKKIINSLASFLEYPVNSCTMGYLDRFFLKEDVYFRDVISENDYFPRHFYRDVDFSEYTFTFACDHNEIGDDCGNYLCILGTSLLPPKDKEYHVDACVDFNLTRAKKESFGEFRAHLDTIAEKMHAWHKRMFFSVLHHDLLKLMELEEESNA